MAKKKKDGSAAVPGADSKEKGWTCPEADGGCGYFNFGFRPECHKCCCLKPVTAAAPSKRAKIRTDKAAKKSETAAEKELALLKKENESLKAAAKDSKGKEAVAVVAADGSTAMDVSVPTVPHLDTA